MTEHQARSRGLRKGFGPGSYSGGIPVKPGRRIPPPQSSNKAIGQTRNRMLENTSKETRSQLFPTNYRRFIQQLSSNVPSSLVRGITGVEEKKKDNPGVGKIKVMLRVSDDRLLEQESSNELLQVAKNRKHVSVFPSKISEERSNAQAPKIYAFDSVFTQNTSQDEICSSCLPDVIQAVLQGADGAVFCYGQSNLGKTFALFGNDRSTYDVGIVPCAINWLYGCINEIKDQQRSRIFVRISAIEVYGRSEKFRDLLEAYSESKPSAPLSINEDPLLGAQLQNQCEIPASSPAAAGYLLDAALASRSYCRLNSKPEARKHSHMVFTLHVYQHKLEKSGENGVSGGRSRLHFIDLGSCEKTLVKSTDSLALSHSSLGHVIMSIFNNSKHVPFKESKLTSILREHLGNVNCRAVMLAHVSSDALHSSDTLSTIQTASRIHRVLKKKNKINIQSKTAADKHRFQAKKFRSKLFDNDSIGSSSGIEYTSESELSCDTVVYVNKNGFNISDRELTDNEGPPERVLSQRYHPNLLSSFSETNVTSSKQKIRNITENQVYRFDNPLQGVKNSAPLYQNRFGFFKPSEKTIVKPVRNKNDLLKAYKDDFFSPKLNLYENNRADVHSPLRFSPTVNPSAKSKLSSIPMTTSSKHLHHRQQKANPSFCQVYQSQELPRFQKNVSQTQETKQKENFSKPIKPHRALPEKRDEKIKQTKNKASRIPNRQNSLSKPNKASSFSYYEQNDKLEGSMSEENGSDFTFSSEVEHLCNKHSKVFRERESEKEMNKDVGFELNSTPEMGLLWSKRPEPVGCDIESQNKSKEIRKFDGSLIDKNVHPKNKNFSFQNKSEILYSFFFNQTNKDFTPCPSSLYSNNAYSKQIFGSTETNLGGSHNNFDASYNCEFEKIKKHKDVVFNSYKMGFSFLDDLDTEKTFCKETDQFNQENDGTSYKTEEKKFKLQETEFNRKEDLRSTKQPFAMEEQLDVFETEEMPELNCSYGAKTTPEKNEKLNRCDNKDKSSCNSITREVCLYDTNSLAMSYVSAKSKSSLSSDTALPTSDSSSFAASLKRSDILKAKDVSKQKFCNVVMTKSTSEDGATLTLVKKHNSSGPTLELLITNENDLGGNSIACEFKNQVTSSKNSLISKSMSDQANSSRGLRSRKVLQTLSQLSPKRTNWSGIARGNPPKASKTRKSCSSKASKLQKPKTSLINRLWSTKNKKGVCSCKGENQTWKNCCSPCDSKNFVKSESFKNSNAVLKNNLR